MGVPCAKTVTKWVEKFKLLPSRRLALNRKTTVIWRDDLVRFAVNPHNWLYFKPERVTDPQIKRLIECQQRRWHDEWWTIGQVAAYHGVTVGGVNKRIREGGLPAVDYGNWWVLKSHATDPRLKFFAGKGSVAVLPWSARLDGWIILARAVGLSFPIIDKLCGWSKNRTDVRLRRMSSDRIEEAIRRSGVPARYNAQTGALFADWRAVKDRFPALTRAISSFHANQPLSGPQTQMLAGVLWSWAQWHADTQERREFARRMNWHAASTRAAICRALEELQSWGLEPF